MKKLTKHVMASSLLLSNVIHAATTVTNIAAASDHSFFIKSDGQ